MLISSLLFVLETSVGLELGQDTWNKNEERRASSSENSSKTLTTFGTVFGNMPTKFYEKIQSSFWDI